MQTNQIQHIIIVDDDEIERMAFKRELRNYPTVKAIITGSIVEACIHWLLLYKGGHMPRAVIVDWNLCDNEAERLDPRDNIRKAGAHYLLNQCAELTPVGLLVAYTGDPRGAQCKLSPSMEGTRVQIVSKDRICVSDLMTWVTTHKSFLQTEPKLAKA